MFSNPGLLLELVEARISNFFYGNLLIRVRVHRYFWPDFTKKFFLVWLMNLETENVVLAVSFNV